MLRLSIDLYVTLQWLERETRREKILEGRAKEKKLAQKQVDQLPALDNNKYIAQLSGLNNHNKLRPYH